MFRGELCCESFFTIRIPSPIVVVSLSQGSKSEMEPLAFKVKVLWSVKSGEEPREFEIPLKCPPQFEAEIIDSLSESIARFRPMAQQMEEELANLIETCRVPPNAYCSIPLGFNAMVRVGELRPRTLNMHIAFHHPKTKWTRTLEIPFPQLAAP